MSLFNPVSLVFTHALEINYILQCCTVGVEIKGNRTLDRDNSFTVGQNRRLAFYNATIFRYPDEDFHTKISIRNCKVFSIFIHFTQ